MKKENLLTKIANEMVETIKDYEGVYLCDLANEMYNNSYYIIGTYQAKEFLKENFEEMLSTIEYYAEEFQMNLNVLEVEKLATLMVLRCSEIVLNQLETYSDNFDDELTQELATKIIEEIKEKLEHNEFADNK